MAQNDKRIYQILCKMDQGYKPTEGKFRILAERETLALQGTRYDSLPKSIVRLTNLKELYLTGTTLTELPPCIRELTSLETLVLTGSPIDELPPSIGQLNHLKKLDLW